MALAWQIATHLLVESVELEELLVGGALSERLDRRGGRLELLLAHCVAV